ncbi:EamA family transporter RarD [Nocardioides guangzhouensis]|uniref:EamA family transporter RarD n=1 Tax=Nocardioides guangzhouensis TaxID=2497878 RepID=A0A4Q4ZAW0_9ACTN|nr:EamA family transporter RarD [Nocardioides guangzhouensis]RYP84254.1 EamA family transporter RarD [Nocardioides guangzhouensis]
MSESRRGFLLGVAAYGMWGAFPLYWPLLEPAGAVEILAHRILWSMITMGLLVLVLGRWGHFTALFGVRRTRRLLTVAALVIAVNWATFIYGVNTNHVVEVSLGYFINPLVTVLMGVLVLHETLRPAQWMALGIATVAVVVLTVDYGRPPWIALVLACSFGTYGLAKKQAGAGAVESLAFETVLLAPLAAAYLVWLAARGEGGYTTHGVGHMLLLASTGIVTALPLICFGAAAIRLNLVTLGLLQYLAPVLQFITGLVIFDEQMPATRWIGFGLVWIALIIFTFEAIHYRRRQLRLAVEASAI